MSSAFRPTIALFGGAIGVLSLHLGGCTHVDPVNPTGFHVATDWPKLPQNELLGQVSGVAIDLAGNPVLFRRAERDWFGQPLMTTPINVPTILRVDGSKGTLTGSIGGGVFAMPHGLTIDRHGHYWVTDVALQQVFELDAEGNVLRTWGEAGVSGNDASHFFMPTDVAILDDGTFFVSDGYGNSRVAKFAADGSFITSWGTLGSMPGQFVIPHGIAIGPDGNVYVADRGNARVQIFDQNGGYIGMWQSPELGRPWSITFDGGGHAFVADGGDQMLPNRSRILEVDLEGHVMLSFGSYGTAPGQMIEPHDIAVDHLDNVYVVEVGTGKRAQKFVPDY